MAVKIIGAVIGTLISASGLFYFIKEKNDAESRKIYGVMSIIGALLCAVTIYLILR